MWYAFQRRPHICKMTYESQAYVHILSIISAIESNWVNAATTFATQITEYVINYAIAWVVMRWHV